MSDSPDYEESTVKYNLEAKEFRPEVPCSLSQPSRETPEHAGNAPVTSGLARPLPGPQDRETADALCLESQLWALGRLSHHVDHSSSHGNHKTPRISKYRLEAQVKDLHAKLKHQNLEGAALFRRLENAHILIDQLRVEFQP